MKKQTKMIITSLVILALVAILGGKLYMDNQEKKLLEQEKQIALQAKGMFKDIKEIDVKSVSYNSSTGSKWFSVNIIQKNKNEFKTSLLLGSADVIMGKDAINEKGITAEEISVIYTNKKEEVLK